MGDRVVRGQTIGVGGDFGLEADGTIIFTWGSNEFNIDLDAGGALTITNLHFEVGDLNASAAEIGIEADGQFDIFWVNQEVTISGGSGASLYLRDVDIIIDIVLTGVQSTTIRIRFVSNNDIVVNVAVAHIKPTAPG